MVTIVKFSGLGRRITNFSPFLGVLQMLISQHSAEKDELHLKLILVLHHAQYNT